MTSMHRKVLVVGGTGVVGRQLVPQLVAAGHQVIATSRQAADGTDGTVTWRRLDLLDGPAARRLVAEEQPDAIIHQATALSRIGNNLRRFDSYFATTNRLRTAGTAALIEAAEANGRPRLIVQSFSGWPAAAVGGPIKTEDDPLDPDPPKQVRQTLDAIKELERQVTGYVNGVVLRYGGLYGPGTSLNPGGPQFEAVRKGWLPQVGDGGGVWSFVHTADAASAAVAALDRGRGIYNIVDDEPAPVAVWLPELARLLGAPKPRRVPGWLGWLIGGDALVRMMTELRGSSNAKAKAELGWEPRFPSWRQGFAAELRSLAAEFSGGHPPSPPDRESS
jgi:2-alkyl-3-oxoalkanoate reductase